MFLLQRHTDVIFASLDVVVVSVGQRLHLYLRKFEIWIFFNHVLGSLAACLMYYFSTNTTKLLNIIYSWLVLHNGGYRKSANHTYFLCIYETVKINDFSVLLRWNSKFCSWIFKISSIKNLVLKILIIYSVSSVEPPLGWLERICYRIRRLIR